MSIFFGPDASTETNNVIVADYPKDELSGLEKTWGDISEEGKMMISTSFENAELQNQIKKLENELEKTKKQLERQTHMTDTFVRENVNIKNSNIDTLAFTHLQELVESMQTNLDEQWKQKWSYRNQLSECEREKNKLEFEKKQLERKYRVQSTTLSPEKTCDEPGCFWPRKSKR